MRALAGAAAPEERHELVAVDVEVDVGVDLPAVEGAPEAAGD